MKAHLASRSLDGQRARVSRQTGRPHLRHHGDVDQLLDVSTSNHARQHPHRPRLRPAHQSGLMGRPQTHARAGHRVSLEQPRAQRSQPPSVERLFLGDWRGHRPLRGRHRLRFTKVRLNPRPTRRARSRDDPHRRLRAALVHGDHHCNPEEAVRIHYDLGSRLSIAIHGALFNSPTKPTKRRHRRWPPRSCIQTRRQAFFASSCRVKAP